MLELALFLEFSSDDVVAPDAAVAQMEQLAASLSKLAPSERADFLAICDKMASEHASDPDKMKYLSSFGETCGLHVKGAEISMNELTQIRWKSPWGSVDAKSKAQLEDELKREASNQHPLFGANVTAVGRRSDGDDVLFLVEGRHPSLAVVHLTWRQIPEPDPNFPWTTFFASVGDFTRECLEGEEGQRNQ